MHLERLELSLDALDLERVETTAEKSERLIRRILPMGRYQIGYLVAAQCLTYMLCCDSFSASFNLLKPIPRCLNSDIYINATVRPNNYTNLNVTLSVNEKDPCAYRHLCPESYNLELQYGYRSIGSDFPHLLADQCETFGTFDPIVALASIAQISEGIGSVAVGILADAFGRKKFVFAGTIMCSLCMLASAFSQNFYVYLVLFALSIIFASGAVAPGLSLGNEYTLDKNRLLMSFGFNWGVGYLMVSAGTYFTKNWRHLQIFGASFGFAAAFIFSLYNESPRWLIAKEKYSQAAKTLTSIARKNGRKNEYFDTDQLTAEFSVLDPEKSEKKEPDPLLKTMREFFANTRLVVFTVVLLFFCFGFQLFYTSLTYNLGNLFTTPYVSIAILGVTRLWAPFVLVYFDKKGKWFRRKVFLFWSFAIVAAFFTLGTINSIAASYLPNGWTKEALELTMTICLLVAASLSAGVLYFAVLQISIEVFPTVIRNRMIAAETGSY